MIKNILFTISIILFIIFIRIEFQEKKEYKKSHTQLTKRNEKYYQTIMCNKLGGIMEYRLKDKARVDCLTDNLAIEVDWAKKWAEGIGQALYYAQMTNKKPAVALIVDKKDKQFLKRLKTVANKFNIEIIILKK